MQVSIDAEIYLELIRILSRGKEADVSDILKVGL